MRIVTSSYALDLSGVPTFTLTMYKELVRRNHDVVVYSPLGGKLADQMNTIKSLGELAEMDFEPDVIVAQHNECAAQLKSAYPTVPILFYAHGLLPEPEQPPIVPMDHYLVINEEVKENYKSKGVAETKISIVRDFIDTKTFIAKSPINQKLQNVLFISNYKKWKNYKTIDYACSKLGLNLKCFGSPYGRNYQIEQAINQADLVISWGRGILEAMSCERAALSFDRYEGDGYITPETYYESRKNNFSGRIYKMAFTGDTLAEEILKYDPVCGSQNRNLVLDYHDAGTGVSQILSIVNRVINKHAVSH